MLDAFRLQHSPLIHGNSHFDFRDSKSLIFYPARNTWHLSLIPSWMFLPSNLPTSSSSSSHNYLIAWPLTPFNICHTRISHLGSAILEFRRVQNIMIQSFSREMAPHAPPWVYGKRFSSGVCRGMVGHL